MWLSYNSYLTVLVSYFKSMYITLVNGTLITKQTQHTQKWIKMIFLIWIIILVNDWIMKYKYIYYFSCLPSWFFCFTELVEPCRTWLSKNVRNIYFFKCIISIKGKWRVQKVFVCISIQLLIQCPYPAELTLSIQHFSNCHLYCFCI